jgi:uncharacterized membrane protein YuzA (DUF378 family)
MKNSLAISFLVLIVIAAVFWIVGITGAVVVPLFGGVKAERIGEVLLLVGMCGELLLYLTGAIYHLMSRGDVNEVHPSHSFKGFGSEKRYGNRKQPMTTHKL